MFGKLFGPPAPRTVRLEPDGIEITATGRQTILDAALEAGVAYPHSCRAGGCGTCKCRLIDGKVKERTDKSYVLSAEELRSGFILGCQSVPKGDVVVEVALEAASGGPIESVDATVVALEPLTHDIGRLRLELDQPLVWAAGQYADLFHPEGADAPRSYSFATAPPPDGGRELEFHVRRVPGGTFSNWLLDSARPGLRLEVRGPYGDMTLRPGARPLLCVAGGSGLAPIKALLEQAEIEGADRPVRLLFGARSQADLYGERWLTAMAARWRAPFSWWPVLSEEPPESDWTGRRGLVTDHIEAALEGTTDIHAYLAGPPPMVDAGLAALAQAGVAPESVRFDRFEGQ